MNVVLQIIVVKKEVLDHLAFVTEGDDELLEAVAGIGPHDMPENRIASNLDHWLGPHRCLFSQPRAESASKNNYLHPLAALP